GAGLLFSLLPALETSRPDLLAVLKDAPGSSARPRSVSRQILVAAQIAISMVLLAGGGLFLRSLQYARHLDLGFDPDHVVETSLDIRLRQYSPAAASAFWQQLLRAVRGLPGVESASLAARLPLDLGLTRISLGPEGFRPAAGQRWPMTEFARVDTDYFRTLRIAVIDGRGFTGPDGAPSPVVIIVNDVAAHLFWPGVASVLGRYVVSPGGDRLEVVGVVRRSKYFSIGEEPRPYVYLAMQQGAGRALSLVARVSGDPAASLRAI